MSLPTWVYSGFPGGSKQEFSNPTNLAWKRQPALIVFHTTEGAGYPSAATYKNGQSAPHFTIDPWGKTFRQHYPLTEAAWALKAPAGMSTNTSGAIQFEVIGTCNPNNASLAAKYIPGAPDDVLAYAAQVMHYVADVLNIAWQSSVEFVPYPASYGVRAPQRLSVPAWQTYYGVLGHEHVPGNDHGDPGSVDIARFLSLGAGATPVPNPIPTPTPPPTPQPGGIDEDGIWGSGTTKRAQQVVGRGALVADGEVWYQYAPNKQPGLTTGWVWNWSKGKGSPLIAAMQRGMGIADDGVAGSDFWHAFQRRMGTVADGEIWNPSPAVKEFQRRLNQGTW